MQGLLPAVSALLHALRAVVLAEPQPEQFPHAFAERDAQRVTEPEPVDVANAVRVAEPDTYRDV